MSKSIFLFVIAALLLVIPAWAHNPFPADAPQTVEENARRMIEAGIDQAAVLEMTRAMVRNKFDEKQMIEAQQIVLEAFEEGLPAEPLMDGIKKSEAKSLPPDVALVEMEVQHERLHFADEEAAALELEPERSRKLAETIAQCIEAGMEMEHVHRMLTRLRERTKADDRQGAADLAEASFETAAEMARLGVSSDKTAQTVEAALKKDFKAEDLRRMKTGFQERTRDRGADDAADDLSREIEAGDED